MRIDAPWHGVVVDWRCWLAQDLLDYLHAFGKTDMGQLSGVNDVACSEHIGLGGAQVLIDNDESTAVDLHICCG